MTKRKKKPPKVWAIGDSRGWWWVANQQAVTTYRHEGFDVRLMVEADPLAREKERVVRAAKRWGKCYCSGPCKCISGLDYAVAALLAAEAKGKKVKRG